MGLLPLRSPGPGIFCPGLLYSLYMEAKKKSSYAKWIAGGLGWAFGGPIGGILGFMLGSMYDGMQSAEYEYKGKGAPAGSPGHTRRGDFSMSLLVLCASVMKADGEVKKSELNYVRSFLIRQFGEAETEKMLPMLRDLLKQEIPVQEVCQQIREHMDYSIRLQLLHFLFGIARADEEVKASEATLIQSISRWLGISFGDFQSVKALFVKNVASAYKILGVNEEATEEEIKKAWKQLVLLHHPDKVAHLGEDIQKAANEKLQQINAAYEEIKKQRGFR